MYYIKNVHTGQTACACPRQGRWDYFSDLLERIVAVFFFFSAVRLYLYLYFHELTRHYFINYIDNSIIIVYLKSNKHLDTIDLSFVGDVRLTT